MKLLALFLVFLAAGGLYAQGAQIEHRHIGFESEGFALRLRNHVQFRLTLQDERGQSGRGGSNGRDFANFAIPRAKTSLHGHVFDRAFAYRVRLNWSGPSGEIVEVAHFRWALIGFVNFNAGQDKLPWNWEESVNSAELRFVERAYVNEVFNQGYARGIWIDGRFGDDDAPWIKYWFGVYNGVLRSHEDFRNDDLVQRPDRFSEFVDGEIMVNLRLETHPLGEVTRTMHDARPEEEHDALIFAVGFGANWFSSGLDNADLRGDTGATATGSGRSRVLQETWALTLDAHLRFYGAGLDAAVYWRYTDFHNRGINRYDPSNKQGIGDLEDFGWSIEASYYLHLLDISFGVRVSSLDADEFWGADAALRQTDHRQRAIRPDAMEYGLTASYLPWGDRLKFTMDVLYVHQQLAFTYDGSDTLLGVYNQPLSRNGTLGATPENADHDVLWIVRMQVQWIF